MDESMASQPWYLVGIGGCGCNIVDDVLARRALLKADQVYSSIYEKGISGWWVLNTNIADLRTMDTLKDMGLADPQLAERFIIAPSQHNWVGCGHAEDARKLMEYDCSRASQRTAFGHQCRLDYLLDSLDKGNWRKAAHIVAINGLGKDTGVGATPVLTDYLKKRDPRKKVFSLSILPFKEETDMGYGAFNALYGLTEICRSADVTMLVANTQLESSVPVPPQYATIQDSANNEPQQFAANKFFRKFINPPILNFLETLVLGATNIDTFVKFVRTSSMNEDFAVLAPLYYETSQIDTPLDTLIENAIGFAGRLIDCKPETAVGAYIILVGDLPHLKQFDDMPAISHFLSKRLKEIAQSQMGKQRCEPEIFSSFVKTNMKSLRVLILLANPQIPALSDLPKKARDWTNKRRHKRLLRLRHRRTYRKAIVPDLEQLLGNLGMLNVLSKCS